MRVGNCRPAWEVGKQRDEPEELTGSLSSSLGPGAAASFLAVPARVSVSGALRFGSSLMGPSVLAAMAEPLVPVAVAPACVWHSASMLSGWPGPASPEQAGQPLSTHSLVQAPDSLVHWFVHQQMFPDYQLPDYQEALRAEAQSSALQESTGAHCLWGSGVGGEEADKE